MGCQCGRLPLLILMHKKVDLLHPLLVPFLQSLCPLIKAWHISGMVCSHIADKGFIVGEAHMQQVAPTGGIHQDIGHIVFLEQLIQFISNNIIVKPVGVTELHGQRNAFGPVFDKGLHPIKKFGPKLSAQLQEGSTQFFFEVHNAVNKVVRTLFNIV